MRLKWDGRVYDLMGEYCWACGKQGCTDEHLGEDKGAPSTYCERCGKFDDTYQCQNCYENMCWECGLVSGDGEKQTYSPDSGFYICAVCAS